MKVTRFDPTRDLIIVDARLWGPGERGRTQVSLAIDTGSSETVISPEIVDELGYSPRDGEAITTVRAAIGKEHGYTIRVARFSALGFTGYGIDGLIGLSLLRQFNCEVRSAEGRIVVDRIAP